MICHWMYSIPYLLIDGATRTFICAGEPRGYERSRLPIPTCSRMRVNSSHFYIQAESECEQNLPVLWLANLAAVNLLLLARRYSGFAGFLWTPVTTP